MKRLLITTLCLAPLVTYAALNTNEQKGSYAFGYKLGSSLAAQNQQLDVNSFSQGFSDGMLGKKPALSPKAQKAALEVLRKKAMKQFEHNFKKSAAANLKASEAFLAQNKNKPGVKTMKNGIQYKILKSGTGPSPQADSTVTVNYEGKLINGKVFDSSYKRGEPATFSLKSVIPGWQQAIPKMKQGGTWIIYIPPNLAYGQQGAPGMIGPNEVLIFKVNLIKANSN